MENFETIYIDPRIKLGITKAPPKLEGLFGK
jgi:hypothetical protein